MARSDTIPKRRKSPKLVRWLQLAAERYYGLLLPAVVVDEILAADRALQDDILEGGYLEPSGKDYLARALIQIILPGEPPVTDSLLNHAPLACWYWPLSGSDQDYAQTFYQAFRKATLHAGVGLVRDKCGTTHP